MVIVLALLGVGMPHKLLAGGFPGLNIGHGAAAGESAQVTITVGGLASLDTTLTVSPGGEQVTVIVGALLPVKLAVAHRRAA